MFFPIKGNTIRLYTKLMPFQIKKLIDLKKFFHEIHENFNIFSFRYNRILLYNDVLTEYFKWHRH